MSAEPDVTAGPRSGPIPVDGAFAPASANGTNGGGNGAGPRLEPTPMAISPATAQGPDQPSGCTAAQLRRFIKSRAYMPMHELRRRFELSGEADDVSPIRTHQGLVYLGLPMRESQLIGDLVRQGEVGLELCRDPRAPIVVGVFPMRPITRQ